MKAAMPRYEYLNGSVFLLRPPSSAYDVDAIEDMAGGSLAYAALRAHGGTGVGQYLG